MTTNGSKLADLRREYALKTLDERDVVRDPIAQFRVWLDEALTAKVLEPTGMTLATVGEGGRPAARIVLLKECDDRGFVFYTNYQSRKGRELELNPYAALLFHWIELERQVRIEGRVEKVSEAESDAYFFSRPVGSQLGAWASPQSEVIPDRSWLDRNLAEVTGRYGKAPPRPPHWGGYRVVPEVVEFWQGRPSRLHDRLRFARQGGAWRIERLSP